MGISRVMNWSRGLVEKTYNYLIDLASRPNAMMFLFIVSFVESSFFPIPPDVMLIPMVLATPHKAWRIAGVATIASVLGGYFGYIIGVYFFDLIARPILSFYGYMSRMGRLDRLWSRSDSFSV